MSTDAENVLRAELTALRRRVRGLALLSGGALVLGAAALASALGAGRGPRPAAPEGKPGVLVGRSLYLREDPDRPYVRLKNLPGGAGLVLVDAEGKGQVFLFAAPEGGQLVLGGSGPPLALEGSPARPSLTLRDGRGRRRVVLSGGDAPGLVLLDGSGRERLELSCASGGAARLRLLDPTGRAVFEAPPGKR